MLFTSGSLPLAKMSGMFLKLGWLRISLILPPPLGIIAFPKGKLLLRACGCEIANGATDCGVCTDFNRIGLVAVP